MAVLTGTAAVVVVPEDSAQTRLLLRSLPILSWWVLAARVTLTVRLRLSTPFQRLVVAGVREMVPLALAVLAAAAHEMAHSRVLPEIRHPPRLLRVMLVEPVIRPAGTGGEEGLAAVALMA